MTTEEVRNIGYLKWKDPLAWMESMKGKRWENHIKREKQHFNELATQPSVEREARQMEKEIIQAQQYSNIAGFKIGCGTVDIIITTAYKFMWKWSWDKKGKEKAASDIDVQGNIVWYVTPDDEDKHYKNKLICESSDGKVIWSKKAVSSQIAIIGELCYYVNVVDYFRTIELCVCNAQTGNNQINLYKERDETREILLYKGSNRTLYMASSSTINNILYRVNGFELKQLAKNSLIQMPLGESIYGDDCILVRKSHYEKWKPMGKPINEWIFPNEEILWVNIQSGNIITINEGAQSIWFCSKNPPKLILKLKVGNIDPNIWSQWENSLIQSFAIKSPTETPFMIHIIDNKIMRDERKIEILNPMKFKPLDIHRFHTISKDGTKVPFVVIKEKGIKPKAQLVYVYGSYGSSTPIGWPYANWYPILNRKWAIVYALVRGSGDIDAAWAEAARRENRHVSVDDFEAVIIAAKTKNGLDADKTVIFGRSAGGLPVGAIVGRYPDGHLVGAAFTEVPYVDILRTSTNPDLPLTMGEFEEFGNPAERILNFKELLSVSPINTLPADGAPGVFVMSRVGRLDRQVYAYESFKWIQRLRGGALTSDGLISHPNGKYVTFERKEAHHYTPPKFSRFRAIDLAILDNWADGKLKF
jgi:pimeloyl-ACP methyl ester carboxylesterase